MTTIADELVIEGIARAFSAIFDRADVVERIVSRMAELRSELLTTAEAAALLQVHPRTLKDRHVEWGLTKSVAMGAEQMRWYRVEIMAFARSKEIRGKVTNISEGRKSAA